MSADADPLAVALAAARPIDDAPRVPLEVERLLSDHARRSDPLTELVAELRRVEAEGGGAEQ